MNTHTTLVPRLARAAAFAVAVLLASCTVGPDYEEPQVTPPVTFAELPTQDPDTGAGNPSVASDRPVELAAWWTSFNDEMLNSLVQRAIDSNPTLREAEARVREARARRGEAAADLWPTVNVSGSIERSRISDNTATGDSQATGPSSGFGPGNEVTLYQAGF